MSPKNISSYTAAVAPELARGVYRWWSTSVRATTRGYPSLRPGTETAGLTPDITRLAASPAPGLAHPGRQNESSGFLAASLTRNDNRPAHRRPHRGVRRVIGRDARLRPRAHGRGDQGGRARAATSSWRRPGRNEALAAGGRRRSSQS